MRDLYHLWGIGVVLSPRNASSLALSSFSGGSWPEDALPGMLFQVSNNDFVPRPGELWWVSFDAGRFFLEERVELPALLRAVRTGD